MAKLTADSLGERIQKFIADTVTLDVVTFTGTVNLVPAQVTPAAPATPAVTDATGKVTALAVPARPPKLDFDQLFATVAAQLVAADDTKLELVAYTHAEWDMDSVNFVRKDPAPGASADGKLLEAHQAAVAAAQKSRLDAVKFVAELVGAAGSLK